MPETTPPAATASGPCPAVRFLRPDIVAMAGYTPGEQVRDCIKLNTNECAWGPSPAVWEVLARLRQEGRGEDGLRLYPDPRATGLRDAAAATYGVTREQVLVGNGSDDCLTILYRAFLRSGDRIACPWPTYGLYDDLATLQGIGADHIDWRIAPDAWRLPEGLPRVHAKMVLVANPNNPSATLVPTDELRRLADRLDGILVVDEAYVDFAPAGASMLPHLGAHPNVVVLRTFSKSYSLAGARLGLLFAHPELVKHLMKVKDSYNVNHVTQLMGIAALQDTAWHAELIRNTLAERARLEAGLQALGWSWPRSAANFLLCEVGTQAKHLYEGLKAAGLLVRYWDRPLLRTKLRITVGRPEHNERLLAELRRLSGR